MEVGNQIFEQVHVEGIEEMNKSGAVRGINGEKTVELYGMYMWQVP